MEPHKLFELHQAKAERVAESICYKLQSLGAMSYFQEARSVAMMELWKICVRFDPNRQTLDKSWQEELDFWGPVMSLTVNPKDPYASFWMYAVFQIRGRVIDLLRIEKIVRTKAPITTFVSLDNKVATPGMRSTQESYTEETFADIGIDGLQECMEEQVHRTVLVAEIVRRCELTDDEREVMRLSFYENESSSDIAAKMNRNKEWVYKQQKSLLSKLRESFSSLPVSYTPDPCRPVRAPLREVST